MNAFDYAASPCIPSDSDLVENPLVVRVDLPGGQVEAELQGDQDAELGGQQLPPVHPEHGLDLLQRKLSDGYTLLAPSIQFQ